MYTQARMTQQVPTDPGKTQEGPHAPLTGYALELVTQQSSERTGEAGECQTRHRRGGPKKLLGWRTWKEDPVSRSGKHMGRGARSTSVWNTRKR